MQSTKRPSVALLTNAPAPYRTPFFNELSKRCRLLVSFNTKLESHREWALDDREFEFEWVLTRGISISRPRTTPLHFPLDVVSILKRFSPDVVVSSELGARTASAAVFCRLQNRPLIVKWEGTPYTDGANSLTTIRRRKLLGYATRVWGNGKESASSLIAYGVPPSCIDLGMTGTDTDSWRRRVEDARSVMRPDLRNQYGLEGTVILFVGHLSTLKGIPELLAALDLLVVERNLPSWSALFVGSGPLSRDIEAWSESHPAVPVAVAGFVQPGELAQYYAASDLMAVPTLTDRWGLVCLDAVVAGIPQVTSMFAGAAADLVTSGEIGVIVDPRDARSLAKHLADRIRLGPQRIPVALRDRAMNDWSTLTMVERAMSSILSVVQNQLPTP
jgi:glycosyltransferase involved in cell wall biosynthesis